MATLRLTAAGHLHWCPACGIRHILPKTWTFNGDQLKPTFSPSFKHDWNNGKVCHYFITAGRILYCSDSTHILAGRTIDLPEIPDASET